MYSHSHFTLPIPKFSFLRISNPIRKVNATLVRYKNSFVFLKNIFQAIDTFSSFFLLFSKNKVKTPASSNRKLKNQSASYFIGDPIPNEEAQKRWGWRYEMKVIY